ncbi:AMP-dependent synthetase [Candidatus Magnetomoraceae bacterium gMMP-15]
MHNFNIYDMFSRNARLFEKRPALVEGEERISFGQLLTKVNSLAAVMAENGITKGDRIGIISNNSYKFFTLFGACSALGAVAVLINWRLSSDEIKHILEDSSPKILLIDSNHEHRVQEFVSQDIKIFGLESSCKEGEFIDDLMKESEAPTTSVEMDDPFCLIYTAAVEGRPRGAVLSHGNIIFGNIQTAATMELTSRDSYVNMLPLFHITGLNLAMSVMHSGGKNVVIEKFNEKIVLEQTEKEGISVLGSFPPILSRINAQIDKADYDLSSLRHVLGIDGPDNIEEFEKKTNGIFWILYGQTETSGLVTFSSASKKPGTAGKQGMLTKVRIVDENEQEVPVGEKGEITVQGPLVFQGFWKQEELNRHVFRNGWHHTGDLGQLDEEGYLIFAGRKPEKELIKPGGENVYPVEVEEVILQNPSVKEVSVIGVPDPKFGEGIKAVCVLNEGESISDKELIEFVASRIARYKKPGYVTFTDALPKNNDGSIDREKVKQEYGTN